MMKLLVSPKKTYLLDAGIEVLHEQSNEWLNEIAFWQDELAFLYTLVVRKTLKAVPVNAKESIVEIENELVRLTSGELDNLRQKVEEHEKLLLSLFERKVAGDEGAYRDKHHQLVTEFDQVEKRVKLLKRRVFELAGQIAKTQN